MNIISLGAGLQSSTMLIMSDTGYFSKVDHAIFADTGDEPEYVYEYLEYLQKIIKTIPISIVKFKKRGWPLSQHILENLKMEKYYISIPAFGKNTIMKRRCTMSFKIEPVHKKARFLMKEFGDKKLNIWIGITIDEIQRMKPARQKYIKNIFPLIDKRFSRHTCHNFLNDRNYKIPNRSACYLCPYHSDREWLYLKINHPQDFKKAVQFERKFLLSKKNKKYFLHRSLKKLDTVEFKNEKQLDMFENECEGVCGV